MDKKIVDDIVWWVPFKKLRNSLREYMLSLANQIYGDNDYVKDLLLKKLSLEDFMYGVVLYDIPFYFYDAMPSNTVEIVANEINNGDYTILKDLQFEEGDCVIDIGANVGMVSIFLAKTYPFLNIYSYEPVSRNYNNFIKNIAINSVENNIIKAFNMAVTKDGRDVNMFVNFFNQGGSSVLNQEMSNFINSHTSQLSIDQNVKSTTLNDIFESNNIQKLKLLKIDCEGSEYDIIYNTKEEFLSRIDTVIGEFHSFGNKYDPNKLIKYLQKYVKNIKITVCNN